MLARRSGRHGANLGRKAASPAQFHAGLPFDRWPVRARLSDV